MKSQRLYQRALSHPAALRFGEVRALTEAFGFELSRVTDTHHIYVHPAVPTEIVNLQPDRNGMAKAYQVRQMLKIVKEYGLRLEDK